MWVSDSMSSWRRSDTVDGLPLLEAIQASGIPWRRVAKRAEIDETQLRRMLGKLPIYKIKAGKKYGPYWQKGVAPHNALRIAKAIHLDPTDLGF
jgi:hypothetical protein